ncbi:MAG: GNAT family N-acetyltransferase [Acidobacteria bacterium]|nr:GNAT family N-acetyltransferase [Acidobacteriota bacterium]
MAGEPKPVVRNATLDDLDELIDLFAMLEREQSDLRPLWRYANGLGEPAATSLAAMIVDGEHELYVAEVCGAVVGFLEALTEDLLPQAGGERVGVVRMIFTLEGMRGVGIGHALLDHALDEFRQAGIHLFDALVSPGHRSAKNFFEAHGFKARLIVMHGLDEGALTT